MHDIPSLLPQTCRHIAHVSIYLRRVVEGSDGLPTRNLHIPARMPVCPDLHDYCPYLLYHLKTVQELAEEPEVNPIEYFFEKFELDPYSWSNSIA